MALDLTGPRRAIQAYLMPDTCVILTPAAPTRTETGAQAHRRMTETTTACGVVDPRRTPDALIDRAGAQVQVRGQLIFRLPHDAPAVDVGAQIRYGGRRYAVVDPGPPSHGLTLARYVGVEEVPA